jgi:hypothetical protein
MGFGPLHHVITFPKVVSGPVRVTWMRNDPRRAKEAANTLVPGPASAGIDSPVIAAWSSVAAPAMTSPSTGICSPGRTTTVSPIPTCSTGTLSSAPSRSTRAVAGASAASSRTAFRALSVVKCSA